MWRRGEERRAAEKTMGEKGREEERDVRLLEEGLKKRVLGK